MLTDDELRYIENQLIGEYGFIAPEARPILAKIRAKLARKAAPWDRPQPPKPAARTAAPSCKPDEAVLVFHSYQA